MEGSIMHGLWDRGFCVGILLGSLDKQILVCFRNSGHDDGIGTLTGLHTTYGMQCRRH
jgi:hypothetical protein